MRFAPGPTRFARCSRHTARAFTSTRKRLRRSVAPARIARRSSTCRSHRYTDRSTTGTCRRRRSSRATRTGRPARTCRTFRRRRPRRRRTGCWRCTPHTRRSRTQDHEPRWGLSDCNRRTSSTDRRPQPCKAARRSPCSTGTRRSCPKRTPHPPRSRPAWNRSTSPLGMPRSRPTRTARSTCTRRRPLPRTLAPAGSRRSRRKPACRCRRRRRLPTRSRR